MLKNLRASLYQRRRENARKFLSAAAREHLATFPQMCCYSFDAIGIDINVDGRFDKVTLGLLLDLVRVDGRNVLDVGANIGNHAAAFAERAGHVFAFEPHPKTYQLLRLNLSGFANTTAFNLGASDRVATVTAITPHFNVGSTTIAEREPGLGESAWSFEVAPLDTIEPLQGIVLFKLDVEGHEAAALRGARGLLLRDKPIVAFEQIADAIENGTSESVEFLRSLGYGHLYEISASILWRTPQALPSPIRKAMRIVEAMIFGPSDWTARLVPVERLEQRDYAMLVATTTPL